MLARNRSRRNSHFRRNLSSDEFGLHSARSEMGAQRLCAHWGGGGGGEVRTNLNLKSSTDLDFE